MDKVYDSEDKKLKKTKKKIFDSEDEKSKKVKKKVFYSDSSEDEKPKKKIFNTDNDDLFGISSITYYDKPKKHWVSVTTYPDE